MAPGSEQNQSTAFTPRKLFPGGFSYLLDGKEDNDMPRTTTRCAACPVARKKTNHTLFMCPLFVDGATPWPPADLSTQQQARALRAAIVPYLGLAQLRRLAAPV